MPSVSHLQRKRDELQKQYDLLSEKIQRLRTAYTVETDTTVCFKLERQVEQAETERDRIEQQIEVLDGALGQSPPDTVKEASVSLRIFRQRPDALDKTDIAQTTQRATSFLHSKRSLSEVVVIGIAIISAFVIGTLLGLNLHEFTLSTSMPVNLINRIIKGGFHVLEIRIAFLGMERNPITPVVTILSIKDRERITGMVGPVHGVYDKVPEYKEIWLVASRGAMCYPMDGPAIKEPIGVWRHGPLEFPNSGQYNLSTVLADANASALFRMAVGKSTGLPCLPDGAEFIYTITVEVHVSPTSIVPFPVSAVTLAMFLHQMPSARSVRLIQAVT